MREVYIENYMALLACIVSETTVEQAMRIVTLESTKTSPKKPTKIDRKKYNPINCRTVATRLIDTKNNEVYEFETYKECAAFLGIANSTVYVRCNDGKLFKNQYRFERIERGSEVETR